MARKIQNTILMEKDLKYMIYIYNNGIVVEWLNWTKTKTGYIYRSSIEITSKTVTYYN